MFKTIRLLNEQVINIINAASLAADNNISAEICGLLIDNGYFIELIQVSNKSKKWGTFEFYVHEINKIEKAMSIMRHEIIGTFHSHPYGSYEPSKSDILNTNDDSYMLIVDVTKREIGLWYIKDYFATKVEYETIARVGPISVA